MPVVAVLDADVLFPMVLRDTLLRVAAAGCYRPHWSGRILDEMTRNLIEEQRMDAAGAKRLGAAMADAFPEAIVEDWQRHEAKMRNHPKDRHVAAAAVAAGATVIVTSNLKDFKDLPEGLAAMNPDAFLGAMFAADPDAVLDALAKQAASYRKPATSLVSLFDWLERVVPNFVAAVRGWSEYP
jgi:hypothetical protein